MTFDYSRLTATCAVESPDKAITLPPEAYGSDELYAAEVDQIFKRGWIPLCRVEQVATAGSYYSIDILGTPLVAAGPATLSDAGAARPLCCADEPDGGDGQPVPGEAAK